MESIQVFLQDVTTRHGLKQKDLYIQGPKRELNNLERWLSLDKLQTSRTESIIPVEREVITDCRDGVSYKSSRIVYMTIDQIKIVNCPCSLYELVKAIARGSLGNNFVAEPKVLMYPSKHASLDIQATSDLIEYI